MKPLSVLIGLICGSIMLKVAGDLILQHGIRTGPMLWTANWIIASGSMALVVGSLDTQVQAFGWVTVAVGATLRMLSDRRRMRGTRNDRRAA